MEVTEWAEEGMQKTVMWPMKSFHQDYVQQADFLKEAVEQVKYNQENEANLYTCSNRYDGGKDSAGYFLPIFAAEMLEEGKIYTFDDGLCFQEVSFQYELSQDSTGAHTNVTVTIDAKKPRSLFCKDWFFIGNTELYHVEVIFKRGKHQITFTNLDEDELKDIQMGGFKAYMFCDGFIDTFISVFKTLLCFIGGLGVDPDKKIPSPHVPDYMVNANLDFLNNTMNYTPEKRDTIFVDIDESLIQSGDFLAIMRLDGLDPIIMYGSGSHAGHSTMALRFDGDLYIVESQDAWYWPKHNIQRTPYREWIQYAQNCDFHVVHMPLSPENRAKFNETAAQEFFNKTEGDPYGYYNFLFGWIDTPQDNYPPLLPSYFAPIAFSIVGKIAPSVLDIFLLQAMNHRLGTYGLDMEQIAATAADRGLTVDDLMAQVEVDGWLYSGVQPRNTTSYVCSSYVSALYSAAGLYDNNTVYGTEMSPRDVYTLNLFDLNYTRPDECVQADPDSQWCQILGKYRLTFPGYSTVDVYDHMAETCPTLAPDYFRPDGC